VSGGLEDLKPMLLTEILPSFAAELEELLKKEVHAELAAQVSGLKIVDRYIVVWNLSQERGC
jgi:hypothetical protein